MKFNFLLEQRFSLRDNYNSENKNINLSNFNWYTIWNKHIRNKNFSRSKNKLEKYVYNWVDLALRTFYCDCPYGKEWEINHKPCWLEHDDRYVNRYKKMEWEHVVPAQAYLWSFKEWKEGHTNCINSKWKPFKGRKCLEKVSKEWNHMISDLHNLFPVAWNLNAIRSNYPVWIIPWEKRLFGLCNIEIEDKKMEPSDDIRWDIARVYKYMYYTYPKYFIKKEYLELLKKWSIIDPISKEECKRYFIIRKVQKSINFILEKCCKNKYPNLYKKKY